MALEQRVIRLSLQALCLITGPLTGFLATTHDAWNQLDQLRKYPAWMVPVRFYEAAVHNGLRVFLFTAGGQALGLLIALGIGVAVRWLNRSSATHLLVWQPQDSISAPQTPQDRKPTGADYLNAYVFKQSRKRLTAGISEREREIAHALEVQRHERKAKELREL